MAGQKSTLIVPHTSSAVPPIVQPILTPSSYTFLRSNHSLSNRLFNSPVRPILPRESAPASCLESECTSHPSCSPSPHLSKSDPDSQLSAQISKLTPEIRALFCFGSDRLTRNCISRRSSGRPLNSFKKVTRTNHTPSASKGVGYTPKPSVFDHRQPYLYLDEPFDLKNSPELVLPTSLIFPCAPQEPDPSTSSFYHQIQLVDSFEFKMPNSKTPISSNHNLIGHRIDQGRLEFMSVLGLGAYGVVYLARDLTSPDMHYPKLYAVKALNKAGLDARQKSFQRREIALHSLASSHPSIVTLHAVIESPSCIFVILDYCPDGDLFGMITEKQKYLGKTEAIKSVFLQIIDAVQFCHSLGIGHRDLKPENILCKNNGTEVVLADFGLATAEKTSSDFGCGSTFYMSPECQGGLFERLAAYSTQHNDIWSLGVILVNLTCGRNPWKQACPTDDTFRAYLANPDFLRSILPISEPCNSLLKRIFAINPLGRISLEDLKDEILRIESFNMTTAELSKATRATREAAHAWLKELTTNPKVEQTAIDFSSWKDVLSKKAKPITSSKMPEAPTDRCPAFHNQARNLQTPNDGLRCVSSDRLVQSIVSSSVSSCGCNNAASHQSRFVPPSTASSQFGIVAAPVSSPSQPSTRMVPVLKSSSISKAPSTSSNERSKRSQGFSSRLRKFSNAASAFSQSSKHEPQILMSCKKLFPKPSSFNRSNAPSPIIVKPYVIGNHPQTAVCSNSGGLITPNKKEMQALPVTPPSSVSPQKSTFGFIKKPSRFFSSSGHSSHEIPPTPSTPNHPTRPTATPPSSSGSVIPPAPSRRCRKILPRSPLSINHREKTTRTSVASHPSDDNFEKNDNRHDCHSYLPFNNTRPIDGDMKDETSSKWMPTKGSAFKSFT